MAESMPSFDVRAFRRAEGAEARRIAETVKAGFLSCGYVKIENHDLDEDLLHRSYAYTESLFSVPRERLQQFSIERSQALVGYAWGDPNATYHSDADRIDMWHVAREFPPGERPPHFAPNHWLVEHAGFRELAIPLYDMLDACALVVLRAFSLAFIGDAELLPDLARGGWSILRYMRYPAWTEPPDELRSKAHIDASLLTLYTGGTEPGLQVELADGTWYDFPVGDEEVLVGTGELLRFMSRGLIRPTSHRVVYPPGPPRSRVALPFFLLPRPDVPLSAISEAAARHGATEPPVDLTVSQLVARRTGWGRDRDKEPRVHADQERLP